MSERPLISLLLPTRKRPALARRFFDSVLATASRPNQVEVILYVDEDDTASHTLTCEGLAVSRIIGPQQSMGAANSACLARAKGDVIMLVNDDVVMRTKGWDEALVRLDARVEDKIYLAYGDDRFKGRKLCTFPILSRHTCDILLQPYHPAYRGAFIDYHLMDIFERLEKNGFRRIFYLPELVFEHLHYRAGKAELDETYNARGRFEDDMLFVGLAPVRAASFSLLHASINRVPQPLTVLPVVTPLRHPPSPLHAAALFTRVFLLDRQLPAAWRFFLWWWFGARYVAGFVMPSRPAVPLQDRQ